MTTTRLEPTTYRRSIVAFGAFAALCLAAGAALERPLVGGRLYAVGLTAAVAVPYAVGVPLFDERDDRLHERTSGLTLALFGWLSALVYPSLLALSAARRFSWGPTSTALAWTTAGAYGVYLLALGYYRQWRTTSRSAAPRPGRARPTSRRPSTSLDRR
jgi:hypothetical protein